jgi:hypothetical protein
MKAGCDQICKKERLTNEKKLFFAKEQRARPRMRAQPLRRFAFSKDSVPDLVSAPNRL